MLKAEPCGCCGGGDWTAPNAGGAAAGAPKVGAGEPKAGAAAGAPKAEGAAGDAAPKGLLAGA